MQDIKLIIAKNIIDLRKRDGMTQAELAERLNYSDKAVSKWERGESVPDITVLKTIADMFSVKVDYLITSEHTDASLEAPKMSKRQKRNRKLIMGMCLVLVWLIATFVFVVLQAAMPQQPLLWLSFVYAVPVSLIVWLVFNSIWFNTKLNFIIISGLVWSSLAVVYLSLIFIIRFNVWLLFLIGIPAQIIVILWAGIRTGK